MADAPGNAGWMKDWEALSRQYWSAWQDVTKQTFGAAQPPAAQPWHEGLEQWSRLFAGSGGAQNETVERLLSSAKGYVSLMQAMIAAATNQQTTGLGGTPSAWTEVMRQSFNMPGMDASLFNNPIAKSLRDISGQGAKSFEQAMAAFAPNAALMGFDPKAALKTPAFGLLREHQEHYQKSALAFVDYQEQTARYNALLLKASQRGFEIFEGKLAEREEPGRQIDSVRALYDLWVDAAEEAYAEIALTDEFRAAYGEMVNAQMRMRAQIQAEVERVSVDLGVPTRSEIDTIGQRLHELRREFRRAGEAGDAGLAREVATLREDVAALKRELAARRADAAPAKQAPAPQAKPAAQAPSKPHNKKSAAARAASRRAVKSSAKPAR